VECVKQNDAVQPRDAQPRPRLPFSRVTGRRATAQMRSADDGVYDAISADAPARCLRAAELFYEHAAIFTAEYALHAMPRRREDTTSSSLTA